MKLIPIGSRVSVFGGHKGILKAYFTAPDMHDSDCVVTFIYGVIHLDTGYYTSKGEMYISHIIVHTDNLTLEESVS